MRVIEFQESGFDYLGRDILTVDTQMLFGGADGFQHQLNNFVNVLFSVSVVLKNLLIVYIVLYNLPVNLVSVVMLWAAACGLFQADRWIDRLID